jgi:RNA recognition motif-containing protein
VRVGFAFVTYVDATAAARAVTTLNDVLCEGSRIVVEFARPNATAVTSKASHSSIRTNNNASSGGSASSSSSNHKLSESATRTAGVGHLKLDAPAFVPMALKPQ